MSPPNKRSKSGKAKEKRNALRAPGEPTGKRGKQSEYRAEYCQIARVMCQGGARDDELGEAFGVTRRTIINWRHSHPEFEDATKLGKQACDDRVERMLYERAVGYTFESEKVFQHQGEIIRAQTFEHVPPDVTAGLKWLFNRRPEEWRDRQEHKLVPPTGAEMSEWELAKRVLFDLERSARQQSGQ